MQKHIFGVILSWFKTFDQNLHINIKKIFFKKAYYLKKASCFLVQEKCLELRLKNQEILHVRNVFMPDNLKKML